MKTNKERKQKKKKVHNNPFIFSFQPILQVGPFPAPYWIEKAVSKHKKNNFQNAKAKFKYQAYYFGGDNLRVYPLVYFRDETDVDNCIFSRFGKRHFLWTEERVCSRLEMPKSLAGKGLSNSWDIFHGNMTFDKFIESLSGEYIIRDFDEEEVKSALGDQTYLLGCNSLVHMLPMYQLELQYRASWAVAVS